MRGLSPGDNQWPAPRTYTLHKDSINRINITRPRPKHWEYHHPSTVRPNGDNRKVASAWTWQVLHLWIQSSHKVCLLDLLVVQPLEQYMSLASMIISGITGINRGLLPHSWRTSRNVWRMTVICTRDRISIRWHNRMNRISIAWLPEELPWSAPYIALLLLRFKHEHRSKD